MTTSPDIESGGVYQVWNVGPQHDVLLVLNTGPPLTFVVAVPPDSANVDMTLKAVNVGFDQSQTAAALGDAVTLTIDLLRPPVILSPAQNALVGTSTVFAGSGGANATNDFEFANDDRDISIVTPKSTFTLGDLARYGITIPTGDYFWTYTVWDNVPTVDAFATGVGGASQSQAGSRMRYALNQVVVEAP